MVEFHFIFSFSFLFVFAPHPPYLTSLSHFTPLPHIISMSKKFKSQASSSRAAASTFGGFGGFSSSVSGQGRELSSLTYVAEPPDLSQISDSQLAIAFKNFTKKDDVTRTKALDDIKSYVSNVAASGGTLEEGFLEAWVGFKFPRGLEKEPNHK